MVSSKSAWLPAVLLCGAAGAQEIRLTGRILEKALGKPVAGALVRLSGRAEAADTTDSEGRFRIEKASVSLRRERGFLPVLPAKSGPGWTAAGRWSTPEATPLFTIPGNLEDTPLEKNASPADRLEVSLPGLQARTLDLAAPVQDLGDIVLDYPPRRLGVGAPPVYGSVVLFDGKAATLDAEWQHWMGTWRIENGLGPTPITWTLVPDPVDPGTAVRTCCRYQWGDEDLVTKRKFRDFQVHLEFNLVSAPRVGGTHPGPANSGVYLQSLYEIQVRDDYGKAVLGNHDAGAILNEYAAPVNLGKPRGQWQAYDITFRAARWKDGVRVEKARLTLHWNGTLAHRNRETANEHAVGVSSDPLSDGPKGLKLQSEGHDVRFRNVWIKELDLAGPDTDIGY